MSMAHIAQMFERACHTENPGDLMVDATYADYEPIPAQDLLPPAPIKFEGVELMGPHNIEAYLTATYGDWQALPPADKRYTHAQEAVLATAPDRRLATHNAHEKREVFLGYEKDFPACDGDSRAAARITRSSCRG